MRKIEEVQKMVEKDVFKLEGVVGVYIREKDNKEVIMVGLKKMDPDITNLIPRQIEGYDVEVEYAGEYSIDW